jgi:hypothetical protein
MSRKVYVTVEVKIVMVVDEGVEIAEVMDELNYDFSDTTGKASIQDTEIESYEITDSN